MSRIEEAFDGGTKPAFIAFTVAGDPDFETSLQAAKTIIDAGADILELGVPFTDPVGDGPVIQKADERALDAGCCVDDVFRMARELRGYSHVPIVLLTYFNPVYRRGIGRFYQDAAQSGVDGILIVDMPPEESDDVMEISRRHGIDQIFLISPTTTYERIEKISGRASGFLYLVSQLGVTGARDEVSATLSELVRAARACSDLPLAAGFGMSRPDHVGTVSGSGADAIIVGSAIVEIIERNISDRPGMMQALFEFVRAMCAAKTG